MANHPGLHITIGAAPSAKLNVQNEIQMVKAALLYGDSATLCSPSSQILFSVAGMGEIASEASPKQQVEMFEDLVPYLIRDEGQAMEIRTLLQEYKSLINKKRLQRNQLLLRIRLKKTFERLWKQVRDETREIAYNAGLEDIVIALESGLLDLHVSEHESGEISDYMVKDFFDAVTKAVTGTYSYPLLDDQTGELVRTGIKEGKIEISDLNLARSKHLGLAGHLLNRLPLFNLATMKEVLDIRSELEKPLIRFRSAMLQFTNSIASAQWDEEFGAEAERVFLKNVQPAVLEIEEAIQRNKFLKELASKYVTKPQVLTGPVLAVVMSQYESLPEIVSLALGGATLSATVMNVYHEWRDKQKDIAKNQLYFYYQAEKLLQG